MLARLCLLFLVLLAPIAAAIEPVTVDPPVTVSLTVGDERLVGDLTAIRPDGLVLSSLGAETTYAWADVSPGSAFVAIVRAGEPETARQWLSLAAFGRDLGAAEQAAHAGRRALQLDASLRADVDRALARELGTLRKRPEPAAEPPAEPDAAVKLDDGTLPPKFAAVPADVAERAERLAAEEAERAMKQFGIRLRLVETEHFLIFTDWEPIDDPWLAEQLEGAYRLLCREFHVDEGDTVFAGRLPVYMFDSSAVMQDYARQFDGFEPAGELAGYHAARSTGFNKLVMSKPRDTARAGLPIARRMWSRTLTHEFVHAFLARYRGGRNLPRWLDEGLAEMLAETIMPQPHAVEIARQIARSGVSIASVFDDSIMPPGELYPVMLSMADALYREDPRRFVAMVDRIKAGADAEASLREHFGVDYAGLERAWRNHMAQ